MSDHCYTISGGEHRGIHIPGCMGCAVSGHDCCTCPTLAERRREQFTEAEIRRAVREELKASGAFVDLEERRLREAR